MEPFFPLTVFAHCPCCGSPNGRSATIKRFHCPDCGFEYFQNAAAAVTAVIRRPDGKILFTRRERDPAKGRLDLPGGFVDPLETVESALSREVREEVGVEIERATFLASFPNRYDYRGVTYYSIDLVFLCSVASLESLAARDEVTDVVFLSPAEVDMQEIGFESVRNIVRFLLRNPATITHPAGE